MCVSAWAYAMCIQAPTKARRGHQISWSWSYRLLWAACNGYWEWRDLCKRSAFSTAELTTEPSLQTQLHHVWTLSSIDHSREGTLFSISWESMKLLIHFFFFFWSVFYGLDVKIQSPSNATCTRNILPVPELACSRPQLLTFIKLYFMKILLQKAHNTVRCMLFPSNVK